MIQTVRTQSIIVMLTDFANPEVNDALVLFLAHIQMEQKAAVIVMLSADAVLPLSPPVYQARENDKFLVVLDWNMILLNTRDLFGSMDAMERECLT